MKRWIWLGGMMGSVLLLGGIVRWALAQAPAPPKIQVGGFNCGLCHREIALDWAQSAHARAFTNEHYAKLRAAQANPDACISCHAPAKIRLTGIGPGKEPKPRDEVREEGISCVDCHECEEAKNEFGRFADVEQKLHAVTKTDEMAAPEFCATCHGTHPWFNTYESWKASPYSGPGGKTCQDCHMPLYSGKISIQPNSPQRDNLRRHTFPATTPEMLVSAATLDVDVANGSFTIRVTNSGTGHNFPGVAGRQVVVEAALLDGAGKPVKIFRQSFGWADYNAPEDKALGRLAPDESRSFEDLPLVFRLEGITTGRVRVRLIYQAVAGDPGSETLMLEKEVPL